MSEVITESQLGETLRAARFQRGERFELRAINKTTNEPTRSSVSVFEAAGFSSAIEWLKEFTGLSGWDFYVCSNPICSSYSKEVSPAPHDVDVESVRLLLIDCDPDPTEEDPEGISLPSRARATDLAESVASLLQRQFGVRVVRVSSGRGKQLWLFHESFVPKIGAKIADEEEPKSPTTKSTSKLIVFNREQTVREDFVDVLYEHFATFQGAHIDQSTTNPARLMRLPGRVNTRTGEAARLLSPGDGKSVKIADLERLLGELRAVSNGRATAATPKKGRKSKRVAIEPLQVDATVVDYPEVFFTPEQARLQGIYECCPIMRECWKAQNAGKKLNYNMWRLFGRVLVNAGEEGEREFRRLDERVVGRKHEIVDHEVETNRSLAPTGCAALAKWARKTLPKWNERFPETEKCGTEKNPCGFATRGTPKSHAGSIEAPPARSKHDQAEVEEPIGKKIREFFESPLESGKTLLVKAEAGLGKTRIAAREIARTGRRVAYLGPTHPFLDEALATLREAVGGEPISIGKRPKLTREMCLWKKYDRVKFEYLAGLNPKQSLCRRKKCPFYDDCEYVKGIRDVRSKDIALYPHVMLRYGKTFLEEIKGRDLIIDEDASQHLAPTLVKTETEIAEMLPIYTEAKRFAHGEARELLMTRLRLLSWLTMRIAETDSGVVQLHARNVPEHEPLRSGYARRNANAALRKALKNALTKTLGVQRKRPKKTGTGKKGKWRLSRVSVETAFFDDFLQYVHDVIEAGSNSPVGVIDTTELPRVVLGYRVKLPPTTNVLVLDATGSQEVQEKLMPGRKIDVLGEYVDHTKHGSSIVQYVDKAFSKTSLKKDEKTQRYAIEITKEILKARAPEKSAVFSYQFIEERLTDLLETPIKTGHFFSTRGRNEYKDFETAIVIGTPRPPTAVIRAFATLVLGATEDEIQPTPKTLLLRYKQKRIRPWGLSDGVLRRALDYIIRSELIQVAGRVRYARFDRKVFILSNFPIDLPDVQVAFASHILDVALPRRTQKRGDEKRRRSLTIVGRMADDEEGYKNDVALAKKLGIRKKTFDNKYKPHLKRYFTFVRGEDALFYAVRKR